MRAQRGSAEPLEVDDVPPLASFAAVVEEPCEHEAEREEQSDRCSDVERVHEAAFSVSTPRSIAQAWTVTPVTSISWFVATYRALAIESHDLPSARREVTKAPSPSGRSTSASRASGRILGTNCKILALVVYVNTHRTHRLVNRLGNGVPSRQWRLLPHRIAPPLTPIPSR